MALSLVFFTAPPHSARATFGPICRVPLCHPPLRCCLNHKASSTWHISVPKGPSAPAGWEEGVSSPSYLIRSASRLIYPLSLFLTLSTPPKSFSSFLGTRQIFDARAGSLPSSPGSPDGDGQVCRKRNYFPFFVSLKEGGKGGYSNSPSPSLFVEVVCHNVPSFIRREEPFPLDVSLKTAQVSKCFALVPLLWHLFEAADGLKILFCFVELINVIFKI